MRYRSTKADLTADFVCYMLARTYHYTWLSTLFFYFNKLNLQCRRGETHSKAGENPP